MPAKVRAAFDAAPPSARDGLLALRARFFAVAGEMGLPLAESLKWGQPSYRAPQGSPLRLGAPKDGGFAIYAHCATQLISDFAALAPEARIDGNRAVLFRQTDEIDRVPLDALIRAAFTYHVK